MLPKKEKFTTSEFLLIKKLKPRKIFTNIGVFCVYPSLTITQIKSKFAIVPTKKIFKTAVSRNQHKRYFYNSLREIALNLDYADHGISQKSIVFYPNKLFTQDEVKTELQKILK